MEPIFHPRTKKQLEHFLLQPTHALLLTGDEGSGKLHVSKWLSSKMQSTMITIAAPEGKTGITIEQIRDLYTLTRTGDSITVVIKDAQQMSKEAQNAFLKLLEEPPRNTRFILTATKPGALLQTIRSRVQAITILAPSSATLLSRSPDTQINTKSLLHTSENLPGKFFTLIENTETRTKHLAAVEEAKLFYGSTIYQRHLICIENSYEKMWSQQLLDILAIIVRTLLKQSVNSGEYTALLRQAELLEATSYNLHVINGNPKIHLAKLSQQLG